MPSAADTLYSRDVPREQGVHPPSNYCLGVVCSRYAASERGLGHPPGARNCRSRTRTDRHLLKVRCQAVRKHPMAPRKRLPGRSHIAQLPLLPTARFDDHVTVTCPGTLDQRPGRSPAPRTTGRLSVNNRHSPPALRGRSSAAAPVRQAVTTAASCAPVRRGCIFGSIGESRRRSCGAFLHTRPTQRRFPKLSPDDFPAIPYGRRQGNPSNSPRASSFHGMRRKGNVRLAPSPFSTDRASVFRGPRPHEHWEHAPRTLGTPGKPLPTAPRSRTFPACRTNDHALMATAGVLGDRHKRMVEQDC